MFTLGAIAWLVILAIVVCLFLLIPALLRWLWNITMPDVFGLKQITFWQAFRLWIIAFLLFGVWTIGGQ